MEYVFHFLFSALEALPVGCVISLMRREYWNPMKISIMVCAVAGTTTIFDVVKIDINVGVNILIIATVLKLLYNIKTLEVIFDTLCSAMVVIVIEMFTTYLLCSYNNSFLENNVEMLIYLMTLTAFYLVALKLGSKRRIIQICYMKYQKGIWIVCLNFLFIQIAELYNWNETNTLDISIIVLVLVAVAANLVLAFKLIKNQQQREELQNQQRLMELKEGFLQQMAAEQHDFAKHLQAIQNVLEECENKDDLAEAKAYVEELINLRHRKQRSVYVGDGVLSAYLNGKRNEADERKINFSILVKNPVPKFPCTQGDLVEIAGNLIDNAFEAVANLTPELKKVFFEIGTENGNAFLQTMNGLSVGEVDPNKMLTTGFSTKNGSMRGYGLSNIKTIAEKYNGKIEIQMNEDVIVIKVLFK